jgi:hypothetical protein
MDSQLEHRRPPCSPAQPAPHSAEDCGAIQECQVLVTVPHTHPFCSPVLTQAHLTVFLQVVWLGAGALGLDSQGSDLGSVTWCVALAKYLPALCLSVLIWKCR